MFSWRNLNYPGQKSGVMTVFGFLFSSIGMLLAIQDKFSTISIPGSQKKKNLDRMFGQMLAHIEGKMGERG